MPRQTGLIHFLTVGILLAGGSIALSITDTSPQDGDPLPVDASFGLGTARYRLGSNCIFLRFSPDSSEILAGNREGSILAWDCHSGKQKTTIQESKDSLLSCVMSVNGDWIASLRSDHNVYLSRLRLEKTLHRVSLSPQDSASLAVSGTGRVL